MKVAELTAYHVRIPLRKPIKHASHTRDSTDNVLVRCVLDDKTVGFGEGVPREYVTGETIDFAVDLLRRSDLPAQLEPCHDFNQALAVAERLQLVPVEGDDRLCHGNAARCAVEIAYLNAVGQHFGEPLSSATRLLAPDLYEPHKKVRYSGAITSANTGFKVRLAALRMWIWWFPNVKVKVGIAGHDDVYRLRQIRKRLGWNMDMRLDANESWSPAEAGERIRALEPYKISAVEQPIPHAEWKSLAALRREIKTPIMLDESLCSRVDAERAIEAQSCDLFNLRLSKCGGFIPTLRLAQLARQHNLGCQLGCQIGETSLLSAAGRHFAGSVKGLRWTEGSYDKHLVREALGTRDITFGWGGWAKMLPGPGLGIAIDPVALERVTIKKVNLL